ncbi:Hypothetical predicted protein [Octopus vulgaris]|uniref:Reverse transcriptase domain-containing protein n=1 Tax=Octopus vulgaris TaxID=6645 RepID=A0AA36ATK2_OCTVU|nr:Hypothetical predicted protein [Octopus vulgaris]
MLEGIRAKNLNAVLLFAHFSKAIYSVHRDKMAEIHGAYGIPDETMKAVMMLYKDTRAKVQSSDGDPDFFGVRAGVLQGDTLAPYLFIRFLDYVLRTSIDQHKDLYRNLEAEHIRLPA